MVVPVVVAFPSPPRSSTCRRDSRLRHRRVPAASAIFSLDSFRSSAEVARQLCCIEPLLVSASSHATTRSVLLCFEPTGDLDLQDTPTCPRAPRGTHEAVLLVPAAVCLAADQERLRPARPFPCPPSLPSAPSSHVSLSEPGHSRHGPRFEAPRPSRPLNPRHRHGCPSRRRCRSRRLLCLNREARPWAIS